MTTNLPTDRFAEVKARYERAWEDLGDRIRRGIATLNALADARTGDEALRLRNKAKGLVAAQDLYLSLHPHTRTERTLGTHTQAWRAFEDRLAHLVKAETDPRLREGMLLANGYQRGYGADIDAAPLFGG